MSSIQRIASLTLYIIMAISVALAILFYFGGSVPETIGSSLEEKKFTSINLIWGVVLFVLTVLITLIFTVVNLFKNPEVIKSSLLVLGLAVVMVVVCYLLASSEPLPNINTSKIPTAMTIKVVGTGLIATYILTAIAFLGIIISEIASALR